MFEALKKKLFSFIKPEAEKKGKKTKKTTKKLKPKKEKKEKKGKKEKQISKEKIKKFGKKETQDVVLVEPITKEALETMNKPVLEISSPEETILETTKEETPEIEEQGFFSKLLTKITSHKLSKEEFEEIFIDLELVLLEHNVALEAVDSIHKELSKALVSQQFKKDQAEQKILESLREAILHLLLEPPNLIQQIKESEGTYSIIFFGINGTGKTTSLAKVAYQLKKAGISCVLAAADTFRAASIEQLATHGERLQIPVVRQTYGADPAAVAFDAMQYAKKHHCKVVLIDTAGRMYTKDNLLKEMEKIIRVAKPNLKLFVGESITGNDVLDQAKAFQESVGIDGIILSKADIDEKAGTVLSVSYITKKPIYFLGTGQDYSDLTPFTKKTVLKNLGIE